MLKISLLIYLLIITEKMSEGIVIKSVKSFRLTKIIRVDKINLKYSPFRILVNLEPTWTPTTDPNNKIDAKTISTV
tara:strand:+ start:266 stop:493 length:228 start_codon:yes stop_codon:yes gene_type:complete